MVPLPSVSDPDHLALELRVGISVSRSDRGVVDADHGSAGGSPAAHVGRPLATPTNAVPALALRGLGFALASRLATVKEAPAPG
jgi:hypothetical protein